jgi:hypothetical protein
MKYRLTIAAWFSSFFENAFVRRVNRRIDIRIVRLARAVDYRSPASHDRQVKGANN